MEQNKNNVHSEQKAPVVHKKEKTFFDNIPSKSAFWLGALSSMGVVFSVGFFILLGIMLSGNSIERFAENTEPANVPSVQAQAPRQGGSISFRPIDKSDWIRGNKKAKITLLEYSDLECPFCKRFHSTMQQILKEYDGKVNWVYRQFPLSSLHSKAPKEAEASECAGELGGNDAFWKYLDKLFEKTPSNNGLDLGELPKIAQEIGLNKSKFESCFKSGRHAKDVTEDTNDGVGAGAQGTPYTVIISGDKKIPVSGAVPIEQIKKILDSLLK